MTEKPTREQLNELKRLSKLARVLDESDMVATVEEAQNRIRDLREQSATE